MSKAERSEKLAAAIEARGSSPMLAACRCASTAAGQAAMRGGGGPGAGLGAALYRRHRLQQAHGLPGFFLLGVGADEVEIWSEDKSLMPDELLWRWRRADVDVSDVKSKMMFTHLVLSAPELEPTAVRAVTGGFSGYGSAAVDLLTGDNAPPD